MGSAAPSLRTRTFTFQPLRGGFSRRASPIQRIVQTGIVQTDLKSASVRVAPIFMSGVNTTQVNKYPSSLVRPTWTYIGFGGITAGILHHSLVHHDLESSLNDHRQAPLRAIILCCSKSARAWLIAVLGSPVFISNSKSGIDATFFDRPQLSRITTKSTRNCGPLNRDAISASSVLLGISMSLPSDGSAKTASFWCRVAAIAGRSRLDGLKHWHLRIFLTAR